MNADLSQFYQVFFDETAEHLAGMEKLLLGLDVSNPDMDDLNAIFRAAHSIKGGAGTFGFDDMAGVTHILETLLDRLRKQDMTLTAGMVNVFLETKDVIAMQLAAHRGEGEVTAEAVSEVCAKLEQLSSTPGAGAKVGAESGNDAVSSGSGGDYSDSGFFDDQPGAPAPKLEQAPPKAMNVPEVNTRVPRVGAKIEIHGQGFGFFDDDEPAAAPPKQPVAPSFSAGHRGAEIPARKDIAKPGANSEGAISGGAADTDFGFFSDKPAAAIPVPSAPKKPGSTSPDAEEEAANQKTKRDFHGKGYGFF